MEIKIFDTYNEYVASGSLKKDDLCFIKALGTWYQGGKVKKGNLPYPVCDHHHPHFPPPPPPHHHHHHCHHDCDCPPPPLGLSVINIDGVAYWAWNGYLVRDDQGNFVKVYKDGGGANIDLTDYATKAWVLEQLAALRAELLRAIEDNKPDIPTVNKYTVTWRTSGPNCSGSYVELVNEGETRTGSYGNGKGDISVTNGYHLAWTPVGTKVITSDTTFTATASLNVTREVQVIWRAGEGVTGQDYSKTYREGQTVRGSDCPPDKFSLLTGYKDLRYEPESPITIDENTADLVVFTVTATKKAQYTVTWKAGEGMTGGPITETRYEGDKVSGADKDIEFTPLVANPQISWTPDGQQTVNGDITFTVSAISVAPAQTYTMYAAIAKTATTSPITTEVLTDIPANAVSVSSINKNFSDTDFQINSGAVGGRVVLFVPQGSSVRLYRKNDPFSFEAQLLDTGNTTVKDGVTYSILNAYKANVALDGQERNMLYYISNQDVNFKLI